MPPRDLEGFHFIPYPNGRFLEALQTHFGRVNDTTKKIQVASMDHDLPRIPRTASLSRIWSWTKEHKYTE